MSAKGRNKRRLIITPLAVLFGALLSPVSPAAGAEIQEPYTLASVNGVLDLLMIAQPAPLQTLTPQRPTGFVYSWCRRPTKGATTCPALPSAANVLAGPHLQLNPGDLLKIHLVNRLPPLTDSFHGTNPEESQHAYLTMNPTNIHTHGMLVSPHLPTATDQTYGDYVLVYTFNPTNGTPTVVAAEHADVRMGSTDYSIRVPASHPSGLYWIHPHVHGISLNQITSGMAGMITIGAVGDYVCTDATCNAFAKNITVRHMTLKDLQVLEDGTRMDQQDATMCLSPTTGGLVLPALRRHCVGQNFTAQNGPDYTGAKWFFSLNGQPYPTITMNADGGEIWRLVNASGSTTYNLSLHDPKTNGDMIFQILSVDGISIPTTTAAFVGAKAHQVPCPGVIPSPGTGSAAPLCADRIQMMPSARAELWVTYRNTGLTGAIVGPPPGATAVFRTVGFNSGPAGNIWPAVDLAEVAFTQKASVRSPSFLTVRAETDDPAHPQRLSSDLANANAVIRTSADCKPLPPGHLCRIYFNIPSDYADLFGMGYEEIDKDGNSMPGTYQPVTVFNPATPTVCVPLGVGNKPVTERWQLVNLSGEDHNFHLHQVKFSVFSTPSQNGTTIPTDILAKSVTLDNVPVVHATGGSSTTSPGGCANPEEWKSGVCKSTPTVVDIPFAIAGTYVYHCHILEHEDGGMMALIRNYVAATTHATLIA